MAELGLRKYESAQDLHRQKMRTQFVDTKIPKMVEIITSKMNKKLGTKGNPVVEEEVRNFIHLGATDFTEKGLRRLEKRIRDQIGNAPSATTHRKSSKRLSHAAENVLSGSRTSRKASSKASGSVRTITHSQKSLASKQSSTLSHR